MAHRSRKSEAANANGGSDFNTPFVKVFEHNRAMYEKMIQAVQEESLKFINQRLEHNARAIESARDCQGISGLISVQNEWLTDVARDYTEHTRHFGEIVRDLAEDGIATVKDAEQRAAAE
jgi:hypothetical protein